MIIIIILPFWPSYMFRLLQGHHPGGIYKGVQLRTSNIVWDVLVQSWSKILLMKIAMKL